jgi:hypothetical protein
MYLTCKIKLKTRESAKSNSTHAKLVNSHAKPEKKNSRTSKIGLNSCKIGKSQYHKKSWFCYQFYKFNGIINTPPINSPSSMIKLKNPSPLLSLSHSQNTWYFRISLSKHLFFFFFFTSSPSSFLFLVSLNNY